jgi:hypothetical protein
MEARPNLEQGGHSTAGACHARRRLADPAEDLEQRGLARPVPTDDAERPPLLQREADVTKGPDLVSSRTWLEACEPSERRAGPFDERPSGSVLSQQVPLPELVHLDRMHLDHVRESAFGALEEHDPRHQE